MTTYEPKQSYYSLQETAFDIVFEERYENITRSLSMKTFRCHKMLIKMISNTINQLIESGVDFFIKTDEGSLTIVSTISPSSYNYIKINGLSGKLLIRISDYVIENITPCCKKKGRNIYNMFSQQEHLYSKSFRKYESFDYEETEVRCTIS